MSVTGSVSITDINSAIKTTLEAATGLTGVLGPYAGSLSNGGEQLELVDRNGRFMDVLDYKDGGRWPVAADGSGASLAKIDPKRKFSASSRWACRVSRHSGLCFTSHLRCCMP